MLAGGTGLMSKHNWILLKRKKKPKSASLALVMNDDENPIFHKAREKKKKKRYDFFFNPPSLSSIVIYLNVASMHNTKMKNHLNFSSFSTLYVYIYISPFFFIWNPND